MIDDLNTTVWATLAPSPIHGIGVFAIRPILKGQRIYAVRDRERGEWYETTTFAGLHPAILTLIQQRWPLALKGFPFQSPNYDARLTSFMNHADTPNYDKATDRALKDISVGEELCEDYRPEAPLT